MLSMRLKWRHLCVGVRATNHSSMQLRSLADLSRPQTPVAMVDINASKQHTCIGQRKVGHKFLGIDLNRLPQHRLLNTNSNHSVSLGTEQLGESTVASLAQTLPDTTGIQPNGQEAGFNVFFNLIEYMSKYLNFIYDCTGFNWCIVIALGVLPVRFITTYSSQYFSSRYSARYKDIQKQVYGESNVNLVKEHLRTREFRNRHPNATLSFKERYVHKKLNQQIKLLRQENKCNIGRLVMYQLFNLPLWIGFSMAIGNMLGVRRAINVSTIMPIDGLDVNGILWFQNLTLPDPYHILPVVMAVSWMLPQFVFKLLTPRQKIANYGDFLARMPEMIILSIMNAWILFMMYICWDLSAGIVYYWTISGVGAITFRIICFSPTVMRTMAPKGKWNTWVADKIAFEKPYTTMWTNFKKKFNV